ncbi:hypothetical protein [Leptolyngbya ohadii]|uniref:hypothetical protein n=1 Tax=Leptolyngbya ohadii TaxID=1962290 RepID=UPI000B59E1A8|nr:hypothetical protein [Leptolyngbya ohadii]
MQLLHVALQDGFIHEDVIVRVNDEAVFQKKDVNTRFQIGFADSFELNVQDGKNKVEIVLPSKQRSESQTLEISKPMYLSISITSDETIEFRASDESFKYL